MLSFFSSCGVSHNGETINLTWLSETSDLITDCLKNIQMPKWQYSHYNGYKISPFWVMWLQNYSEHHGPPFRMCPSSWPGFRGYTPAQTSTLELNDRQFVKYLPFRSCSHQGKSRVLQFFHIRCQCLIALCWTFCPQIGTSFGWTAPLRQFN